jgi:hypothetical protein
VADKEISAVKALGRLVYTPLDDPDLETGLQVMEDRTQLERTLDRVVAPDGGQSARRRAL